MNALDLARTAYGSSATPIKTARAIEYDAFARITKALKNSALNSKGDYGSFVKALYDNRKLWNILASDVTDDANALPKELRAQIFYLATFTNQHTSAVLKKKASADALIDINTSIMRGLSREGGVK